MIHKECKLKVLSAVSNPCLLAGSSDLQYSSTNSRGLTRGDAHPERPGFHAYSLSVTCRDLLTDTCPHFAGADGYPTVPSYSKEPPPTPPPGTP